MSYLPLSDDAIILAASICALGSILVTTTAVDSGLGKRGCLLGTVDIEQIQIKVFIATILFVLATTISKLATLLFLHRLANTAVQRVGVAVLDSLVLLWTIAVISGTVFQCEQPQPWEIWTGKCIPLVCLCTSIVSLIVPNNRQVPFWVTATAVDVFAEISMILLSVHLAWVLHTGCQQKMLATLTLSLRLL